MVYSVEEIRKDFPILQRNIEGKRNTFLDTAASAQKPQCVMDKMIKAMTEQYANVHRGAYYLSEYMTFAYEQSRKTVQRFINAASSNEVVFTRNATESINLVASTWGRKNLKVGDEVLISEAEHHANLVTWQVLRDELGFTLKIFKVADDGSFLWNEFFGQLSKKTKLVAVTAMSNVLGTIFPIKKIAEAAHKNKSLVLVDACQFAVHGNIDVQDMDCDFLAFSGHKTYGPTGIGVLYGKSEILNEMPPYQLGGEMVDLSIHEMIKQKFNVSIDRAEIEHLKESIASLYSTDATTIKVLGQNLYDNSWQHYVISSQDIYDAVVVCYDKILEAIKVFLNSLDKEYQDTIYKTGVFFSGLGCEITGFEKYASSKLDMNVYILDSPATAVVEGALM